MVVGKVDGKRPLVEQEDDGVGFVRGGRFWFHWLRNDFTGKLSINTGFIWHLY